LCAIWSLGEKLRSVALSTKADTLLQVLKPERVFFVIPRTRGMPAGSCAVFTWLRMQSLLCQIKLRKAIPRAEIVEVADQLKALLDRAEQGGF
jgi:hypothetical protein